MEGYALSETAPCNRHLIMLHKTTGQSAPGSSVLHPSGQPPISHHPTTRRHPQGSVLSPTLFSAYVNNIPIQPHILLAQFADDTALVTSSRQLNTAIRRLQAQLDALEQWLTANKIKINTDKTQALLFTRRRPILDVQLKLFDQNIAWTNST